MPVTATLNLDLVRRLTNSFPNDNWQTFFTRDFFDSSNGQDISNWGLMKHLKGVGGVYAILLPTVLFSIPRILHLHAPQHSHGGKRIPFQFTLPDLSGEGYGVVYVGRTTNLCQRWRGHLTRGKRKDGGQVKYGLIDCEVEADIDAALRLLRKEAKIIYTVLPGPEECANRDILELSLCARFGPPFNIKSER
jgi:hypothetical protein